MKRTDKVTKLISVLLFIVLVLYVGTYLLRSLGNDLRTAPVISVTVSDTTPTSGIVVRNETLIQSDEPYLSIHAEEGRMIHSGSVIALAYKGEDGLKRAAKIKDLERKKRYITAVLNRNQTSDDLCEREDIIADAITNISASSARHDTDRLSDASITLETLVLEKDFSNATQNDLEEVDSELFTLRQNSIADTKEIRTDTPGLFTSVIDGYEYLTTDLISSFTPNELKNAQTSPKEISQKVIGKIVNPFEWYFVSTISKKDAKKLEIGKYAKLDFGRYSSQLINGYVKSISPAQNDEKVVVFRCTEDVSDMLSVRRANAEIVYETHSGLRVQKDAVYNETQQSETDPKGTDNVENYVYTLTGVQAEKKYINILFETDDYYLVEPYEKGPLIREGNEIILSKKEPKDGQIMIEG